MKNTILKLTMTAVLTVFISFPANVSADMSQLISLLTSNLNVSKDQATGGAGTLFASAKEKLSPSDFSTISDALPGIDDLISAASKIGGSSESGAAGMIGAAGAQASAASSLGALSGIAGTFSKLGLSPDMIGKFSETILQFTDSTAGAEVMNLLKSALI